MFTLASLRRGAEEAILRCMFWQEDPALAVTCAQRKISVWRISSFPQCEEAWLTGLNIPLTRGTQLQRYAVYFFPRLLLEEGSAGVQGARVAA